MLFDGLRFIFFLTLFCLGNSLFAPGDYSGSGSYLEPYKPLYPLDTYEKPDMYGYEYGPKDPGPSIVATAEPKSWGQLFYDFFDFNKKPIEQTTFGLSEPKFLTTLQGKIFKSSKLGFDLPKDNRGITHLLVAIDARKGKCNLYGFIDEPKISRRGFSSAGVISHIRVLSGQVIIFSSINPNIKVKLIAGEQRALSDILSNGLVATGKSKPCLCRGVCSDNGGNPYAKPDVLKPCSFYCLKYKACPKGHFGRNPEIINMCRICGHWFNDVIDSGQRNRRKINVAPMDSSPVLAKPALSSKKPAFKHELPKPRMQRQAYMSNPNAPAVRAQMTNQSTQRHRSSRNVVSQPTIQREVSPVQKRSIQTQPTPQEPDLFDQLLDGANRKIDKIIDFFS